MGQQEKSLRILLRYARVSQGCSYSVLKLSSGSESACLLRLLLGESNPLHLPPAPPAAVALFAR
jgi:hypothetical protein